MNDVSIATEVTSIKTAPTQRRSRANRKEKRDWYAIWNWREDQERAKHREENKTNKAKIDVLQWETSSPRKSSRTSLCWSTSWRSERLWTTWTRKLRVEHRSHREHLTCAKERHNTNFEEHNTADLHTNMFGGIENEVARKKTWTSNPEWYEWWRLRPCEQRFQSSTV